MLNEITPHWAAAPIVMPMITVHGKNFEGTQTPDNVDIPHGKLVVLSGTYILNRLPATAFLFNKKPLQWQRKKVNIIFVWQYQPTHIFFLLFHGHISHKICLTHGAPSKYLDFNQYGSDVGSDSRLLSLMPLSAQRIYELCFKMSVYSVLFHLWHFSKIYSIY